MSSSDYKVDTHRGEAPFMTQQHENEYILNEKLTHTLCEDFSIRRANKFEMEHNSVSICEDVNDLTGALKNVYNSH